MLVREGLVETAWDVRHPHPGDLLDLRGVRQAGHVPYDGPEAVVGSALGELEAVEEVVAALRLDDRRPEGAGAAVQLGVLDLPGIDHPGLARDLVRLIFVAGPPALTGGFI